MVKNVDFSNVLEWVDKPVWVVTNIGVPSNQATHLVIQNRIQKKSFEGIVRSRMVLNRIGDHVSRFLF